MTAQNLQSVVGLKILAKNLISSQLLGVHKSRYQQTSREFNQYRAYQPGDNPQLIDWKAYARSDRYYIKETHTERQVNVHFLLDSSASMLHQNQDTSYTKLEYARMVLATLAYLVNEEGMDTISLTNFAGESGKTCTNKQFRNLDAFLHQLLLIQPSGTWNPQRKVLSNQKTSNLFVFISDFYESDEAMTKMIQSLSNRNNEVLVLLLLFENELSLKYPQNIIFRDLETQKELKVNTKNFQKEYQKRIEEKIEKHRKQFTRPNIDFALITNNLEVGHQLRLFIQKRQ